MDTGSTRSLAEKLRQDFIELCLGGPATVSKEIRTQRALAQLFEFCRAPSVVHIGVNTGERQLVVGTPLIILPAQDKTLRSIGEYTVVMQTLPHSNFRCFNATRTIAGHPHPHVHSSGGLCT